MTRSFLISCVITCLIISGTASSSKTGIAPKSSQKAAPKWRTDLGAVIGSDPVRLILGYRGEPQGRPQSSLWFIDSNRLLATFVTRENEARPELSERGKLDSSIPLRLCGIFLDVNTGAITNTTKWPTESRRSRIVGVHDGKFVTLRQSVLTLYSDNLSVVKEVTLPPLGLLGWLPHTSPSGKTILFSSAELRKGPWIWVETDTLKILSTWEDDPSGYVTISDDSIATSTCLSGFTCIKNVVTANEASVCMVTGPKCEPRIQIRGLSTDWKTIAVGEPNLSPHFVNDDLIFLPGDTDKLIRTDGTVIFREPRGSASGECWGTSVLPSANGLRFVIPSCQGKGAVPSLDISGHSVLKQFRIFDIGTQIQTQLVDVGGKKIQDEMQFAISPDGSKLAILSNEFVQVFELPPASGPRQSLKRRACD